MCIPQNSKNKQDEQTPQWTGVVLGGQRNYPQGQDVWANIWSAVLAVRGPVVNGVIAWPGPEVLLSLLPKTARNSTANLHFTQILCITAHFSMVKTTILFDQKWPAVRGDDLGVLGNEARQRGRFLTLGWPPFLVL